MCVGLTPVGEVGGMDWFSWNLPVRVLVTATFAGQLAFLVPFGVVGIEVEEWRVAVSTCLGKSRE